MNNAAAALTFAWLGMVVAISFIEAPLKFRAPGVTVPIGLQIGRLVFRALNRAELILGLAVLVLAALARPGLGTYLVLTIAPALLLVQVTVLRPRLNRRTAAVLAGDTGPRSHAHLGYVALECLKAPALLTAGFLLLT